MRRLRKLQRTRRDEACYEEALRTVHEALNGTAGGVVFAETLDQFFIKNPEFGSIRATLESFFSESRAVFFQPGEMQGVRADKLRSLVELCRRGGTLDRGLA